MRSSVLIVIMILMASSSLHVEAARQPSDDLLVVIITYQEGEYDLGSEVPFTVHILEDCEYVDPDIVTVTTGYKDTLREIEVHRTGTGLWEGTIVIQDTDIRSPGSSAYLEARVEKGPDKAWRKSGIALVRYFKLDVAITFEDGGQYMAPGGSRSVTWHTLLRGEHLDVGIEVRRHDFFSSHWGQTEIPVERVGKGMYRSIVQFREHQIGAKIQADINHTTEGGKYMNLRSSFILYTRTMHVWAKRVETSEDRSVFDLHVSDVAGEPLEGAKVDLDYTYLIPYGNDDEIRMNSESKATTDGNGVARLTLDHMYLKNDTGDVDIGGTVTWKKLSQEISYTLYVREPLPPGPWSPQGAGLEVHEVDQTLEFSEDENWAGRAYVDGEPLSSSWLHCYLVSRHDLMVHENITTDAQGDFSIDLRTPDKGPGPGGYGHSLYIAPAREPHEHPYERGNGTLKLGESRWPDYGHLSVWEYNDLFRTDDMTLGIHASTSERGMEVTMDHPDASPGCDGVVVLGINYDDWAEDLVPDWTYWTQNVLSSRSASNGGGTYVDVCRYEDGEWKTDIVIPDNVPSEDLFLWATINEVEFDGKLWSSFLEDLDYSEVVPPPEEGQPPEKVCAGVLLLVATVIVAMVITRRQDRS